MTIAILSWPWTVTLNDIHGQNGDTFHQEHRLQDIEGHAKTLDDLEMTVKVAGGPKLLHPRTPKISLYNFAPSHFFHTQTHEFEDSDGHWCTMDDIEITLRSLKVDSDGAPELPWSFCTTLLLSTFSQDSEILETTLKLTRGQNWWHWISHWIIHFVDTSMKICMNIHRYM